MAERKKTTKTVTKTAVTPVAKKSTPATKTAVNTTEKAQPKPAAKTTEKATLVKVEFNNQTYEMSTRDRDLFMDYNAKIQEILSNAKIAEDIAALRRVMGRHYSGTAIYDYENGKFLRDTWGPKTLAWHDEDDFEVARFKSWFNEEFKKYDMTLAYCLVKRVEERSWPGDFKWTESNYMQESPDSDCAVVNYIVRDKAGNLKMFNENGWLRCTNLYYGPSYGLRATTVLAFSWRFAYNRERLMAALLAVYQR